MSRDWSGPLPAPRFSYLLLCVAAGLLSACTAQPPAVEPPPELPEAPTALFDQESMAVQERVNEYLYADVVPKLRKCWSGL
jgi:hypothetical protein